jgi:hypothetical protein
MTRSIAGNIWPHLPVGRVEQPQQVQASPLAQALYPRPQTKPPSNNRHRDALLKNLRETNARIDARRRLMRFQINGQGWPLGDMLAPAGTVFDFDKPDHWTQRATGKVIPLNATPPRPRSRP